MMHSLLKLDLSNETREDVLYKETVWYYDMCSLLTTVLHCVYLYSITYVI